jgi:membrane protein implicated in regulation of membrane protease activity
MFYYILGAIVIILIIVFIVRKRSSKAVHVNPLEKYIGQEAVVTEAISDTLGTGKVTIDDIEIQAQRNGPGIVDIGTKVEIVDVGVSSCTVKIVG